MTLTIIRTCNLAKNVIIGLSVFISAHLSAAEPMPNHDIVVFDLVVKGKELSVTNPKVIADSKGYDNQPNFSADGQSIYFTRIEGEDANMWVWSSKSEVETRVSSSQLSEFSPTPIPFEKGALSTVRVEADGAQRLWRHDPKGEFSLIFKKIKPVGYHVWQAKNIAMFVLGEPHTLQVTNIDQNETKTIDSNIGRCLQKRPDTEAISYTVEGAEHALLKTYDFKSKAILSLTGLPKGSQDYVWYSNDRIISSDGNRLLVTSLNSDSKWQSIQNLTKFELSGISRMAISPDRSKLAVVHIKAKSD